MELKQLKSFFYVADTKSFSSASVMCNLTQSAVSQHVKALEEELGTTLLIRTPKGVRLTESGEVVFAQSKQIFREVQYCKDRVASIKGCLTGTLRIGVGSFIAPYLREAAVRMAELYPNVLIVSEFGRAERLNYLLRNGEIDLAFTMNTSNVEEGIETMPCIPFKICAVMPKTHQLAGTGKVSVKEIESHGVILPDAGERVYATIKRHTGVDAMKFKLKMLVSSPDEILAVLRKMNAVTFLPSLYVRGDRSFVAREIAELDGELVSNAHWKKDIPLKQSAEVFLDIVRNYAVPYLKAMDI